MHLRLASYYPPRGTYSNASLSAATAPLLDHCKRIDLLQILNIVQNQLGWIPPDVIARLAASTSQSATEIHGIIDFYHFLHTEPARPYQLYLSTNITDYLQGQAAHLHQLQSAELANLRLATTACTGLCDQGPAALINGYPLTRLTPQRMDAILHLVRHNIPLKQWPDDWFAVTSSIRRRGALLDLPNQTGAGLHNALAWGAEGILSELQRAQLRGRGGAGFSTASKWRFCQQASGTPKYVVCNADEGEPGTFKDRVLLQEHIHSVLEGMTIAAAALGAQQGFIYLRAEYLYLVNSIEQAIVERHQLGLLGDTILGQPGFNFDVHVHLGAGAYVCGEESALLESLEGRRGIPRRRPPFPVTQGYLNCPTVVNNVETFWCVNWIARQGGAAFAALGCNGSTGNKLHSISGDCHQPGIYEFSFGDSVADMLAACGAEDAQAVQVGGPSGRLLTRQDFDLPVNFDQVSSGGSFMVFNPQRDLLDICRNFTDFFRDESCGFCTPCRVGTRLLSGHLETLAKGHASPQLGQQIDELTKLLSQTSHCGLGSTAGNPVAHLRTLQPERFSAPRDSQTMLHIDPAEHIVRWTQPTNGVAHHD